MNPAKKRSAEPKEEISTHEDSRLEENICVHIFTVSAAMVGVCLTVIGLIQIVIKTRNATTLANDFLALDALLFLTSCLLSYWALRKRNLAGRHRVERIADVLFIIGMIFMVTICAIIAYEITYHETAVMMHHVMHVISNTASQLV